MVNERHEECKDSSECGEGLCITAWEIMIGPFTGPISRVKLFNMAANFRAILARVWMMERRGRATSFSPLPRAACFVVSHAAPTLTV